MRITLAGRLGNRALCARRAAEATGAGELLMTTQMYALADRIRNPEMVSEISGPDAAGSYRPAR